MLGTIERGGGGLVTWLTSVSVIINTYAGTPPPPNTDMG